jgi:putative transposase
MEPLEAFIEQCGDVREMKRALSVKMGQAGLSGVTISELLQVSPQYVSKWQKRYEREGVQSLTLKYGGSQGYLSDEQVQGILAWIKGHVTLSLEALIAYIEQEYEVVYQSKQSYYALLEAGGMSYHKTEKVNPKRDESQVQTQQALIKKNWRRTGKPSSVAR